MSNQISHHKFDYGNSLVIKKSAPLYMHPGEIVSVCSIIKNDNEDTGMKLPEIGFNWIYTVEFGDGSSIEIPEFFLEEFKNDNQ